MLNVFSGLKNQAHNSQNGMPYGVPHGRGPNLLMWNSDLITTPLTSWDAVWEGNSTVNGKISIYDSSIYIADAAIHLMAKRPELGITNPYQLNEEQFAAAIDLLEKQEELGVVYWSMLRRPGRWVRQRRSRGWHHMAVHEPTCWALTPTRQRSRR